MVRIIPLSHSILDARPQGADYWAKYQKDPLYLRVLVAVLSVGNVLKSLQTVAILWCVSFYPGR